MHLKREKPNKNGKGAMELIEGDFYFENGYMVFTAQYLKRRGYCCSSGCRHCPYGSQKSDLNMSGAAF